MIGASSTFKDVVAYAISIIGALIPVLAALALILFLFGVVRFVVMSGNEREKSHSKEAMLWGLVALFVLVSVWGIIGILRRTFLN